MRRDILDWRNRHQLNALMSLSRLWQDLKPQLYERLGEISWNEAAVSPSAYIKKKIDPILKAEIANDVERIMQLAKMEMASIMEHHFEQFEELDDVEAQQDALELATEILTSIGPLAGGLVLGAALPSLAVVSGTVAFGLVATSTVSIPILVGGLAIAGGAVATGIVKTSSLRTLRANRIKKRLDAHVRQAVFSLDRSPSKKSILLEIQDAFDQAANLALEKVQ